MIAPRKFTVTALAGTLSVLALSASANAAAVFYSFDNFRDGSGSFTAAVTAIDGFASATSVSGSNLAASPQGGEGSFTDFEGNIWTGSGGSTGAGHSLQFNPNTTGGGFSLTLNTVGLKDLDVRMGIRSAVSSGATRVSGFHSLTYDTGSGPVAVSNLPGFGTNNNFNTWSLDLSAVAAIENQPAVTFQWSLPNVPNNASVRADNIQFEAVAIPEPGTLALAGLGVAGMLLRRRQD